jgi:nucleoside-diphosphate-sugar epimerase
MKNNSKFLLMSLICASTLQATALKYKIELPSIWRNRMIQKYAGKKVVVTGGCGFIGSHLAAKLVDLGAQVTIIDNLSTGFEENIKNIKSDVTFIKKSITDMDACLEATKGAEVIFHLAAFISVPLSLEEPRLCHEANIDGTFNLLEAARINGVKRLVFSSSSAVYGPTEERCAETNPTNPKSPYGFSKLIGEELCKQYTTNFGIETVMLRYFNVYGPRQNPKGSYAAVVARFSDQLKNNAAITIFGNGLQTRDFVPVSQVADANLIAGISDAPDVSGEIFNVATGTSITLLELVDQLRVHYPESTSKIAFGPERSTVEVQHTSADVNKFMNLIQL